MEITKNRSLLKLFKASWNNLRMIFSRFEMKMKKAKISSENQSKGLLQWVFMRSLCIFWLWIYFIRLFAIYDPENDKNISFLFETFDFVELSHLEYHESEFISQDMSHALKRKLIGF